jgi:membrane-bound metal-dependent hydrolase YbcI (DUF457 family)
VPAAGVVALARCDGLPNAGAFIYSLSALAGGSVGAAMPDGLEPGRHGHHRDVFHSVGAGTAVTVGALKAAARLGVDLRTHAAQLRTRRMALPQGHQERLGLALGEFAIYALLGFTVGFAVGYATHIAADMTTPRGVPLVARRLA